MTKWNVLKLRHIYQQASTFLFSSRGKGRTSPSSPIFSSPIPSSPLPLPFPLSLEVGPLNTPRGSGQRCKLPQWGLGRSPSRQTIWCILEPKSAALVAAVFVDFHSETKKCIWIRFLTGRRPMRSFSPGVVVNIAPWKSRLCIYLTLPDSFLTIDSYIPTHIRLISLKIHQHAPCCERISFFQRGATAFLLFSPRQNRQWG